MRQLRDAGVQAVAVCFLYGFVRTEHEETARRILAEEFPEAFACVSHQVAPEFREFERMSTAVVNAYLGPVMQGYIRRLGDRLADLGMSATPHLTQSNGGVIGFEQAARLPVRTVLSGPSTGVVGAQEVGRLAGFADLITFDMGGTSTDVALLQDGQCRLASEAVVHGYPIKAPMLDIHTVGAGGGSIAFVDSGGLLKVGPRSAGADPGPVCYARGNAEPTVTDANVVLQTLNPTHLLGGRMAVRQDLARAAIERLAASLRMDAMATAQGIISVVTANMARAIRVISVQRGHDPRDYTLVAFGGAGPLHAARLAKELEIGRILVPRNPGILCAMGLLLTDLRADFATTRLHTLSTAALPDVADAFRTLRAQAEAWFARGRHRPGRAANHANGGHALCRAELRAAGAAAGGRDRPGDAGCVGRRFRRRASTDVRLRRRGRPGAAGHLPHRGGRRGAESVVPAAARRRTRCIGRHRSAPRCLAAGGGRLRVLPGLRPRQAAIRQSHRRPGDRRADGCDDGGAARYGRAGRAVPEPDSGADER